MVSRGQIQIEVVADTTKFAADLQRKLRLALAATKVDPVKIDGDTEPLRRKIKEAKVEADASFGDLWSKLTDRAGKAGFNVGRTFGAALAPALASSVAPAITGLVSILSSFGPALAVSIPAAAGAVGVLGVALFGVGKALGDVGSDQKKFDESTAGLSKNALKLLTTIRGLIPQFAGLKNAVQDRFFAGLDVDAKKLTKTLLGPLKSGMTQTAGTFNTIIREGTAFAASSKGVALVNAVFSITNTIISQLTGLFGPLLNRISDYVVRLSDSGVNSALQQAKDTLAGLGTVASNVGSALASVFPGFTLNATSALDTLIKGSAALKDFLASAAAQGALAALGTILKDSQGTLSQVLQTLPQLLPVLANLASGGFGVLTTAVQALLTAVKPFVDFLASNPQAARDLGTAIGTIVVAVKAYQAIMVTVTAAQIAWKAITITSTAVAYGFGVAVRAVQLAVALSSVAFYNAGAAVTTATAALWGQVTAAAATLLGWVRMGAAAVVSGAQQAAALATSVAGWVVLAAQSALATVRLVAYTVATNAVKVATIAWTGVQWLLNAAMTANPIGIVIAIIVALVAAIIIAYNKSDTFRAIVQGAFAAISAAAIWLWNNALKPLWDGIVFGFNLVVAAAQIWWAGLVDSFNLVKGAALTLWGWITSAWNGIVAAFNFVVDGASKFVSSVVGFFTSLAVSVATKINSLVSFVTGIPGKILSAIGNLGSLLYNAGSNIVQGLIDGIGSMVKALTDKVGNVVQKIRDFLPFSPAKVGPLSGAGAPEKSGAKIISGVAAGIIGGKSMLADAMTSATSGLTVAPPGIAGNVRGSDGAEIGAPGSAPGGGVRVWPRQPAAAGNTLVIQSDGTKYSELLVAELSKAVRVRGGNVQKVIGKAQGGVS